MQDGPTDRPLRGTTNRQFIEEGERREERERGSGRKEGRKREREGGDDAPRERLKRKKERRERQLQRQRANGGERRRLAGNDEIDKHSATNAVKEHPLALMRLLALSVSQSVSLSGEIVVKKPALYSLSKVCGTRATKRKAGTM